MIAAIDCDLHRVHCASVTAEVCSDSPSLDEVKAFCASFRGPLTILYEVAGVLDYTDNKAIAHHKRRWTIFNVATACELWHWLRVNRPDTRMLVAPSNKWTKGYDVKTRHVMAKCTRRTKDLRECEAMMWFFNADPQVWQEWPAYLLTL